MRLSGMLTFSSRKRAIDAACIAVVAHGGTNRVILAEALGLPLGNIFRLAQDYAAWSLIEYRDHDAIVHILNQRPAGAPVAPSVESRLPGKRSA